MIQIRMGQYETNSSSCHVYVYDDSTNVTVPSVVRLTEGARDSALNTFFNDYLDWYNPNDHEDMKYFLQELYRCGVRTIESSNKSIKKLASDIKESGDFGVGNVELLKIILFGDNIIIDTLRDDAGIVFSEYVAAKYGKNKKFVSVRVE